MIMRIYARIIRSLELRGIYSKSRQFINFDYSNTDSYKILVIGPGSIEIPPEGWGAVETIISEIIPELLSLGFQVHLLNSRHRFEIKKARKQTYDAILCHSDFHLDLVQKYWPGTIKIAVAHYGLGAKPEKWDKGYKDIIEGYKRLSKVVFLNDEIARVSKEYFAIENGTVIANGSNFNPEVGNNPQGAFLYLGKVEPRKRQFELCQSAPPKSFIFAGPIADSRVSKDFSNYEAGFIGPISRQKLQTEFKNYKALVLTSIGEADALVLYEAQLAGLPIIVTKSGLGHQDASLPWIGCIADGASYSEIQSTYSKLEKDPDTISNYARENYRWELRITPVVKLIKDLIERNN